MDGVDFRGGWDSFWSAIESAIGSQAVNLLTIIGLALIVFAIFKWVWDRRKGGGGGGGAGLIWMIVAGAVLAAPQVLLPIALQIVDWIVNAAIRVWNSA